MAARPFPKRVIGTALTEVQYGLSLAASAKGNYPIVGMKDIRDGRIHIDESIRVELDDETAERFLLRHGDVLLNRTNSNELVGKCAIYDGSAPAVFASYLVRLKFDEKKLLPAFANYFLNSEYGQSQLKVLSTRGVSQANINPTTFRKHFEIPFAKLDEQRRIVRVLDAAERLAKTADKLAELHSSLHQRRLREIFSSLSADNKSRPASIGQLGYVATGGTPASKEADYWNGGIAWITPAEVTGLPTRLIHASERTISELGLRNCAADVLPPRSLIVCTRATVGDACINTVPMAINQGFKAIIPNDDVDVDFLYFLIQFLRQDLVRLANGSTFLEIGKRDFESIEVCVPPLKRQKAIATLLVAELERVETYQVQAEAFRLQKRGLMQQLLTGRQRLTRDLPGMEAAHV